jgi:hypothetical protein
MEPPLIRILAFLLGVCFSFPANAFIHHGHRGSASLAGGGLPLSVTLVGNHVFNSNTKDYAVGILQIPASGGFFSGTLIFSNSGVCAGLGADNSNFQIVTSGLSIPIYTLETLGSPLWSLSSGSYHACVIATQGSTSVSSSFTVTGFRTAGVSSALYTHPPYTCLSNYYVSTTGSDSNNGLSSGTPFLTIQKANDVIAAIGAGAGAGVCVNVAAGTYPDATFMTASGNQASSTGFLVFRCSTLGGCIQTVNNSAWAWLCSNCTSKFVIIDGFTGIASSAIGFGSWVNIFGGVTSPYPITTHHLYFVNNEVSGYGETGIQTSEGDYFYAVNNKVHGNSTVECVAQGSGISIGGGSIEVTGYTPSSFDFDNLYAPGIGSIHNSVSFNWLYNNATTMCGTPASPTDTDGNNIIIDESGGVFGYTSSWVPYAGQFLVSMNVSYNSGGKGMHNFASAGVIMANNSCFNSSLDPGNNTTGRPCLGMSLAAGVYPNAMYNNLAIGIPVAHAACDFNSSYAPASPYGKWATGIDSFSNALVATTLSGTISGGSTSLTVAAITNFPSTGQFVIIIDNEEMLVTAGAGTTTWTVTRSYAGTTAASHTSGVAVTWVQTDIQNNITQNIGGNPTCVTFYYGGSGDYYVIPAADGGYSGDQYPLTANQTATSPGYNHVGDISIGTDTTPPIGIDFSLAPSSPAIGYSFKPGGVLPAYLPWWAVDAGAIPHQLPVWP